MSKKNDKIKVLIVVNDFLVGGAQRLIVDLCKEYDREKYYFSLLTLFEFSGQPTIYDQLPEDICVTKLSFSGVTDITNWLKTFFFLFRVRPDVVLANLHFSNNIMSLLKIFFGYRLITVIHNTHVGLSHTQRIADRIFSLCAYKLVAVSKTVMNYAVDSQRLNRKKFEVIHNGVDVSRLVALSKNKNEAKSSLGLIDKNIIINVARLTPQKNQALLIESFSYFVRSHPNYVLLIVGDGGEMGRLKDLIIKLSLEDKVYLLGYRKDVVNLFSASDFFISTSKIEGLSIAYLEALSVGLPLLATRTAGTDELIENDDVGSFIEEDLPMGIAKKIETFIKSDLSSMSNTAKKKAVMYDIGLAVKKYQTLISMSINKD